HRRQLGIPAFGREMQRRHAIAARRVDVGALLQQRAHRLAIAFHRRVGHRSTGAGSGGNNRAQRQREDERLHSANSPVLSPNCCRSSTPSRRSSVSITFAIGVPSAALMFTPPFSMPLPPPKSTSGQRRWLWMLASAIGEPQTINV